MRLYNVTIEGQTPLLQKRKVREIVTREPLPKDHPLRNYIKGDAPTTQDFKRLEFQQALADYSSYRNGHGVYMPAFAMRHSLIEGARKAKVKNGRATIWKSLQGTMFPGPSEILVKRNGEEIPTYDRLKDSLPRGTSGLVLQFQAEIDLPWTMNFQLLMLDDNITDPNIKDIINGAGLYAGIGAWISGGYGRFFLDAIEETELPERQEVMRLLQPA